MSFCAICAADIPPGQARTAPLGKDNAMVTICADCDGGDARSWQSWIDERGGYEIAEGASLGRVRDAADRVAKELGAAGIGDRNVGAAVSGRLHDRTPRWILIRVSARGCDAQEARMRFRKEPWFAEVRYLGMTRGGPRGGVHVFERPDPRVAAEQRRGGGEADPLAGIEQFRTEKAKP
jgi:hypothetical protein